MNEKKKRKEIWRKPERDFRDGRCNLLESKELEAENAVAAPTPWKRVAIESLTISKFENQQQQRVQMKWIEEIKGHPI